MSEIIYYELLSKNERTSEFAVYYFNRLPSSNSAIITAAWVISLEW